MIAVWFDRVAKCGLPAPQRRLRRLAFSALLLGVACTTRDPVERFRPVQTNVPSSAGQAGAEPQLPPAPEAGAGGAPNTGGSGGGPPASSELPDLHEACGSPPLREGSFTREALRAAAADCAIWQYCRFDTAASALEGAVKRYVEGPEEERLASAREHWRLSMQLWSRLELFQFGPAASKALGAGRDVHRGEGIRELIYSWPVTSRCRVEEEVFGRDYVEDTMDKVLISGRGLFALEYLLFYEDADTACAPSSPTGKGWAALSLEQVQERKRDYVLAVAQDVQRRAGDLLERWIPEGDDFRAEFVSASGYPNDHEALTVLAWSLTYVEQEVKDWKLGVPASKILTAPVNGPEAPYAHVATENLRDNLVGFRSLFQGCAEDYAGIGFDDWLSAANHAELAEAIVSAADGAQAALEGLPPLESAPLSRIEDAHRAVKALTDLLKAEFFGAGSPLGLKLPAGLEGDTD